MTGNDQAENLTRFPVKALKGVLEDLRPSSDAYNTVLRAIKLKRERADLPAIKPSDTTN